MESHSVLDRDRPGSSNMYCTTVGSLTMLQPSSFSHPAVSTASQLPSSVCSILEILSLGSTCPMLVTLPGAQLQTVSFSGSQAHTSLDQPLAARGISPFVQILSCTTILCTKLFIAGVAAKTEMYPHS